MSLIPRLLFYPTLGYSVLISKCTSRKWYNRVDETVLIGALPLKSITKQLIEEENVKGVLSMNENYELKLTHTTKEWAALGVDHLQLSTVDLIGTPSLDKLRSGVDFILSHRAQGNCVYVHCKAGRTRSATAVVCYLMKVNNWSPETACDYLKRCRPHIWLREKQMGSILQFNKELLSA